MERSKEIETSTVRKLALNVQRQTGFKIKWKFKPYESENIDEECIALRKSYDLGLSQKPETIVDPEEEAYQKMKTEFEERVFKVKGCDLYVECKNKKLKMIKETDLLKGWRHLSYGFALKLDKTIGCYVQNKAAPYSFISRWISDTNIKLYDDIGIYPPPLKTPENHFNLWTGFPYEDLTEDYTRKPDELQEILDFIRILCRHDQETYDFFVKWIAHMLQYPAEKTGHFPIFVSDEGIGKGTFCKILEKLVGTSKFLETTTPEKNVWGKFNSLMTHKFLVYINEFGKKNQEDADGQIKGLLTDGNLQVESKGKDPIEIISYHRFIGSTNNEDPTNVRKGNRRKWIIRCSDELKNNKEKFNRLYKLIDDDNVIRTFYDYLMKIECDDLIVCDFPKTEYHQILEDCNENIMERFLKWSIGDFMFNNGHDIEGDVCTNHLSNSVEYKASALHDKFIRFKTSFNVKNFDFPTSTFIKKLKAYCFNLPIKCVETKHGDVYNTTIVHWGMIKVHFNV